MPRILLRMVTVRYLSNCYVIGHPDGIRAVVVDPGSSDMRQVTSLIERECLSVDFIMLTHEHFDHISGLNSLRAQFSPKVVASRECSARLGDPRMNFSLYAMMDGKGIACSPAEIEIYNEVVTMNWEGVDITFMETPGHSPGSMCISVGNLLFSGDTIIPGKKTVVRLPESSRESAVRSLDTVFARYDSSTLLCPGHGEVVSLGSIDRSKLL